MPFVHTSAASVPNPVNVLVPAAQTFAGIEVIDDAIDVSERPSEVDAVRTWALVFVLMFEASEVEAARTVASVLALIAVWLLVIALPSDDVAV